MTCVLNELVSVPQFKINAQCICLHLLLPVFQEASPLQSVNSLAAGTERKASVLLKVSLSSPGVIGDRGQKRKHPAATRAHIYNTLVAWFLSVVCEQWLFSPSVCHYRVHSSPCFCAVRLAHGCITVKTRSVRRSRFGLQDFSSCGQKMDWLCMFWLWLATVIQQGYENTKNTFDVHWLRLHCMHQH